MISYDFDSNGKSFATTVCVEFYQVYAITREDIDLQARVFNDYNGV